MKRWQKITLAAVLTLLLLMLLLPLTLPPLVRHYGGGWLQENTGRTLSLGDLSLNLFTWTLELRQVALSEPNSAEKFVAFERLTLKMSPLSLFQRALIVREFQLVAPSIRIVRQGDRFNFSDFTELQQTEEQAPAEPAPAEKPLRFSLNNLQITDGALLYIEQQENTETQRHRIADLDLAVPFIGNTPYLADQYVTPALHVIINDAPLDLGGKLKLFSDAVEVAVNIDLKKVDLPFYYQLLPKTLPLEIPSGTLGSDLELVYRVAKTQPPDLQISGDVQLSVLRLKVEQKGDLLFLPFTVARIAPSHILNRELHLERLHIYNLEAVLGRDSEGRWNFAELLTPAPTTPPAQPEPVAEQETEPPFLATLDNFLLKNGRVVFQDQLPAGGFASEIQDLTLAVNDFSTAPQARAGYRLSLQTDHAERLQISGNLVIEPLEATADIALNNLQLETYTPYLQPFLTAPLAAVAGLEAQVAFREGTVQLADGRLELQNIGTSFGGDDGVKLARLTVAGVRFNGSKNRLDIGRIELADGSLALTQSAEGRLSCFNLLREAEETADSNAAPATTAPPEASAPLHYQLEELAARNLQVTFTDEVPHQPVRHQLSHIELSLQNLAGPDAVSSPFQLRADYGRKGKLDLSGQVVTTSGALTLDSRLQGIALADFTPYLPDSVRLILADGALNSKLNIALRPDPGGLQGSFAGNLGIHNFYCLDAEHQEELLRWNNLLLDGIRGELSPFALHIDGIALDDYAAKLVIDEKGQLNLQSAFAAQPEQQEPPPAEPVEPAAEPGPPAQISIDAITLQNGTVAFTDRHLQPAFATTMLHLGGRVGRISSSGEQPAEIDLRGNLENLSPLRISGQINPLVDPLFADIKINFSDIELSPITPYTGTYLGYVVDKGKLFLDLEYRIDQHKLQAQNRVLLDQFTFGQEVESEQAVNLPVRLAVALLKDRNGKIQLNIPVSGSLEDPEFSVASVIFRVLKNLLVKAATSPLSLLQAAFGGSEDFTATLFPLGSAELPPQERDKLAKLVEMLLDRPALRLEIAGFADADQDPEAYRQLQLQRLLQKEKFLDLVDHKENLPGQTAADMTISEEEYEPYLKQAYKRAEFPKPRNFFGFDKKLPAEEMEKLLLANIPAGPEQMAALAQQRAAAVVAFLTQEKGLPMERLFLLRPDLQKGPKEKGASGNRVEFGVVAQ